MIWYAKGGKPGGKELFSSMARRLFADDMDEEQEGKPRMEEKGNNDLLSAAAAQLRLILGDMPMALSRMAPVARRLADPQLDRSAALLYRDYYRLVRLLNKLSDASFLEEETVLPRQEADIVALVWAIVMRAEPQAELLGLRLSFSCEESSHWAAVNTGALERVVLNLLSNAFKFTPRGGSVTVTLRFTAGIGMLTVTDTGCGMGEEQLGALFSRPVLLELADALPPRGLGLGLAVCRHLARGMGGGLVAVSQPGEGTRVTLSFADGREADTVRDPGADYSGGFNRTLLELADALPVEAFLQKNMD